MHQDNPYMSNRRMFPFSASALSEEPSQSSDCNRIGQSPEIFTPRKAWDSNPELEKSSPASPAFRPPTERGFFENPQILLFVVDSRVSWQTFLYESSTSRFPSFFLRLDTFIAVVGRKDYRPCSDYAFLSLLFLRHVFLLYPFISSWTERLIAPYEMTCAAVLLTVT